MSAAPTAADLLRNLEDATAAVFALARATMVNAAARSADDDEWTRIPAPKGKCPVSRWSRSTILRHLDEKHIRGKRVRGARFYSLKDVREFLQKSPA